MGGSWSGFMSRRRAASSPSPTRSPRSSADRRQPMATTESSLREEVAAVTLLLNDLGILGYSGHVSARLPGDRFLIQSYDQSRASLRPGDLLVCDLDGRVVAGPKGLKPPSEVFLHCEILRSRADVDSVAHFHHDLTTAFTLVEGVELRVLKNHAV